MNNRLAIIIPTFNRADCIKRLLESIARQDVLPEEIIIVDGGTPGIEKVLRPFNNMGIKYVASDPPSLTRQKNVGISKIGPQINLVGFIDDDVVLGNGSLKNMFSFWETADPETGGVSFNNTSDVFRKAGIFEQLFFINSFEGGKILRSGFNSQISSTDRTKRVDWLFGGITVWRRKVIEEFKFDECFTDNAYCEDIDYSYRVSQKYKMIVLKEAKVLHLPKPLDPGKEYFTGKAAVKNRIYFVKKSGSLSVWLCYWGCIGLCLNNLVKGISRLDSRYLNRARGNLIGLCGSLNNPRYD